MSDILFLNKLNRKTHTHTHAFMHTHTNVDTLPTFSYDALIQSDIIQQPYLSNTPYGTAASYFSWTKDSKQIYSQRSAARAG